MEAQWGQARPRVTRARQDVGDARTFGCEGAGVLVLNPAAREVAAEMSERAAKDPRHVRGLGTWQPSRAGIASIRQLIRSSDNRGWSQTRGSRSPKLGWSWARVQRRSTGSAPSAAAVRRCVGGTEFAGQLAHLLAMAQRPNVEIRIMPFDIKAHAGFTTGPFTLLGFPPRGPLIERPIVYVDGYLGFFFGTRADEVAGHENAWANLAKTALSTNESANLITQRLQELQQPA
ncbi:DUF5753 domain-containing protein [Kribbella sp. NPDC023972]|uniref:DUF5753 domain-containing protein n=1 Tax=Kribbella sp. NPDC023972 TaxID=3154795 RepID=UPI0033ED7734